jgi:hypothetical protein
MKIVTRTLVLALLAAVPTLLTACADKTEEAPAPADPTPTYKLSHYFFYPATNEGAGIIHPNQDIKGQAQLAAQVLALDFTAAPDAPHFEINRAQLKADWKGTYSLRCGARPTDPVFVSYSYHTDGYRIFRFSDFTQTLTGDVTITAYDAKRQLISGHYEVNAPGQRDPASDLDQKCNILLVGDFTDVKVTVQ